VADPQSDFVQTYGGLAQDIAGQTGLDPTVVLGQIAQETGWGLKVPGNNLFGISPNGQIAHYPTVQDAASAYINTINTHYPTAAQAATPEAQAAAIKAGGYATDPNYATSVARNARTIQAMGPHAALSDADLDAALTGAPASPASPPATDSSIPTVVVRPSRPQTQPAQPGQPATAGSAPAGSSTAPQPMSDADLDAALIGGPRAPSVPDQPAQQPPGKPGQIDPLTGKPFQFMGTADNSPVAQSTNKPIAEGQQPGVVTQAEINLATDPDQRRRIAAAQLFPGMAPLAAQSRMFYGPDGRLAAVGTNGQPFYVDPVSPRLSLDNPRLGNPLLYAASGAGGALPVVGGIAGGAMAGPGSLVLGPGLAAGGAATGDLARQALARHFDPSATPPPIDYGEAIREGVLSGAGQLGGGVLSNAISPNLLRISPAEVNLLRAGPIMPDTQAAYANARAQGVNLTPGQATGLASLRQYEDAATTMPGTVDRATGFYRSQGNQLQAAAQNMLSGISPIADKNAAAEAFQGGAEDAIRLTRQNANAKARPSYDAAQRAGQVMSPDLMQLEQQPAIEAAMEKAKVSYQNLYRRPAPDMPDFALWDLTKRQLDDAHTTAVRAGERTDAMAIDSLRGDLLTHLDAAYLTYGTARATAAPGQSLAARLEASGVGTVADKTGDERARAIMAPIFGDQAGVNPRAVAEARDAFAQAGRSNEWYAGVRSYIQDAFDRSSRSQEGLNPSMLRNQVWGNVDNKDAIQAALTPQQYQGFDNFMRTVEQTARTFPKNSLTATRINSGEALRGAAANQGNVRAVRMIMSAFSPIRLANTFGAAGDTMAANLQQRNLQQIVGRLFSPDGLQYLRAMSAYSPKSLRAIQATSQLIARALPNVLSVPTNNNPALAPPEIQSSLTAVP
jgi:Mannosyl-glycoprotein endo-beta-N-acetylglucosaminidase